MNIAVFLPNWIGDVVLATPALRALRSHYGPRAKIHGVMRPYVAEVLAGTPWLDASIISEPGAKGAWELVKALRRHKLDMTILMTNSLRTAALARLGGARERMGYVRNGRGWLLNRRLYAAKQRGKYVPSSALDYYLDLAYAAGCPIEPRAVELGTTPEDERQADHVWDVLDLPDDRQVVALNNGGAFGAAKSWPEESFAALAHRIADETGRHVLMLCGPAERDTTRRIAEQANHPRVSSIAGFPPSIGLTKACVRRSGLLVTTDSGPRHFAAAFGVPVVTLFGPTHIAWSENYFEQATHLQLKLDCSPCQQRVCPLGHHRCMKDLSVERVYAAVQEQLRPRKQARAA